MSVSAWFMDDKWCAWWLLVLPQQQPALDDDNDSVDSEDDEAEEVDEKEEEEDDDEYIESLRQLLRRLVLGVLAMLTFWNSVMQLSSGCLVTSSSSSYSDKKIV